MSDMLPLDWAVRYAHPNDLLRPPSEVVTAPSAVMCASRADYLGVIRRLSDIGMIAWTQSPRAINGLFGVPKEPGVPDSQLRLIIDARPANAMFVDPPHVELPTPDIISRLSVPQGATLYIAKADISDFYHRILMPEAWWPYFALPSLTVAEAAASGIPRIIPFGGARGVRNSLERWYPCIKTLPMGFSHAVPLAQRLHEHFIDTYTALSGEERINSTSSMLIGASAHCSYIDDLTLAGLDPDRMNYLLDDYIKQAEAKGLTPKHSKTIRACTRVRKSWVWRSMALIVRLVLHLTNYINYVRIHGWYCNAIWHRVTICGDWLGDGRGQCYVGGHH